MKPVQTFDNFPPFANAGSRQAPGDAKYSLGFVPADTLPAEWGNYFFHGATKGISDLNSATRSIWLEMNSVLEAENITPDANENDQLLEALNKIKAEAILAAHPVGSLYWTSSSENPAVTFGGGTWTQIKDKFILAAGDTYTNGGTGGAATVTLTENQIPSHNHSFTPSGSVSVTTNPTFTGSEHSHTYTPAGSVSVTTNPTFTGTAVTSGGASTETVTITDPGHTHTVQNIRSMVSNASGDGSQHFFDHRSGTVSGSADLTTNKTGITAKHAHTHSVTAKGTISGGAYKFTGTQATLKATQGGTISGGAYSFTGTAGTTDAKGGGGAHENMPPYIVKYCWERTA